jgi:hypothetical protein
VELPLCMVGWGGPVILWIILYKEIMIVNLLSKISIKNSDY